MHLTKRCCLTIPATLVHECGASIEAANDAQAKRIVPHRNTSSEQIQGKQNRTRTLVAIDRSTLRCTASHCTVLLCTAQRRAASHRTAMRYIVRASMCAPATTTQRKTTWRDRWLCTSVSTVQVSRDSRLPPVLLANVRYT